MATSPTSYLQTLANDEAIAFVASLQKVKDHLSHELQWLTEQARQKTSQVQGIETLLSEAETLGLLTPSAHATPAPSAALPAIATDISLPDALEVPSAANGSAPLDGSTDSLAATIAALPVKTPSTPQRRGRQSKAGDAKTPTASKPSAKAKTDTAKAKQPKSAASSTPKTSQRGKASDLQRFLQSQFSGQSLTESVGKILNRASTPLTADDVMAELYDGLSKTDYQRAKNSVTNILSVGKSKGAWKSGGRGRYASNSVTTV